MQNESMIRKMNYSLIAALEMGLESFQFQLYFHYDISTCMKGLLYCWKWKCVDLTAS